MNTLQHSLVTYLSNPDKFQERIATNLLPDAIRMYTGPRQYSHFEASPTGEDVSYMEYPIDVQSLTKETVNAALTESGHLVSDIPPCVLGEESIIDKFKETNQHLPESYYEGVLIHLVEDHRFDELIRDVINCSDMYNDKFYFEGVELNGKAVRSVIAQIEDYGVYALAKQCYEQYGVVVNQDWFEENVLPELQNCYPEEMANNTYKYMSINPQINEWITKCDFSHMTQAPLAEHVYSNLYQDMLNNIAAEMDELEQDMGGLE